MVSSRERTTQYISQIAWISQS